MDENSIVIGNWCILIGSMVCFLALGVDEDVKFYFIVIGFGGICIGLFLRGVEIIEKMFSKHQEWKSFNMALENDDQLAIADYALKASNTDIKKMAVHELNDQTLLAKVAMETNNVKLGTAAVEKVEKEIHLFKITMKAKNSEICMESCSKINEQKLLFKAVLETTNENVCNLAVGKLTDNSLLAALAIEANDSKVRNLAVGKLTDNSLLAALAIEANDSKVRIKAVQKIEDQSLLFKIALEDIDTKIRKEAVNSMKEQISIAKIAMEVKNLEVGKMAVQKLSDNSLLAKVAKNGFDAKICEEARRKQQKNLDIDRRYFPELDRLFSMNNTTIKRRFGEEDNLVSSFEEHDSDDFLLLLDQARRVNFSENLWNVLGYKTSILSSNYEEFEFRVSSWLFQFEISSIILPLSPEEENSSIQTSELKSSPGPVGIAPLENVRIGFSEASQIAEENEGMISAGGGPFGGGSGMVMLNMRYVDGESAPIWLMPHRLRGIGIMGVRADTGNLVFPLGDSQDKWSEKMLPSVRDMLDKLKGYS